MLFVTNKRVLFLVLGPSVTVNTNSYSLTGLTSGGVYRWQIYSMCDANNTNNSPFSSNVIFTTTSCNLS